MASLNELWEDLSQVDNRLHTIVIENLEMPMRIGIYAREKQAPQRMRISVEALVLPHASTREDRIEHVVDYGKIHAGILAIAEGPHINLQENFAEAVADVCFAAADGSQALVLAVQVDVRKLDAYQDCASVGVRIIRRRSES